MGFDHTTVMPGEILFYQNLKPGAVCVDGTLGGRDMPGQPLRPSFRTGCSSESIRIWMLFPMPETCFNRSSRIFS